MIKPKTEFGISFLDLIGYSTSGLTGWKNLNREDRKEIVDDLFKFNELEILVALAQIGVTALVDEATKYQEFRWNYELNQIFKKL